MAYAFGRRITRLKCLVCGGDLERSNAGNICNACKDRMRGSG